MRGLLTTGLFSFSLLAFGQAAPDAAGILRSDCFACHRSDSRNGGLALDSRQEILSGGNRGPAAKAGDPDASLLIQAVEQKGDLKMPPGRQLKPQDISALRSWVKDGLNWPAEEQPRKRKGWDHWSFQPVKNPPLPEVQNTAWVKNPIDRFVLARLEAAKVAPSSEAEKLILLRRVSLDVTGLPPTFDEIQSFLHDSSPDAYEKVVDRLLSSPHYGERWARHWLDLARYSDSDGYTIDDPRPMWKYRDWVIQSLNRDQPFNQFVVEQIAGDLLPNPTVDQLIATGFHRNTASNFEGGVDYEQYRNEAVADRVATTGSAFLGLSFGCARCHDHKYDPFTQREFYQIFSYFNNTDEITSEAERSEFNRPILELPTAEDKQRLAAWQAEVALMSRETAACAKRVAAKGHTTTPDPVLAALAGMSRAVERNKPPVTAALIMRELPKPRPAYIHLGGEFTRKGASVSPATPAFLEPKVQGGNRLDLAKWIADPRNPLTARVAVNRMWQAYFGKGLVETENDFGLMGAKPTHPELLDWLATQFVAQGWSQKAIHRLIVTSAAYRQSSKGRPDLEERDPYNQLLARQNRLRVEAEILRDSSLVASGTLNPAVGGPSVHPPIPPGALTTTQVRKPWPTAFGPDRYRRGVYTFAYRSSLHPALGLFDAPDGTASCTRRVRSNSPLQALTMLNDTAAVEFARALGQRIVAAGGANDRARLEYGFLLALGRRPNSNETERLSRFLAVQRDAYQTDVKAAKVLIGGAGDSRAIAEAEEGVAARPGGPQSARGLAESWKQFYAGLSELQRGRAMAEKRKAEIDAMNSNKASELAAWTAVSRVLLNLDDFVTRN